jgi:ABC-type nitrate/sulfonate/bicarbonate transport system substrate-binding protein
MAGLACLIMALPVAAQTLKYGLATVSLTYAPLYVAEDMGFFKQEGAPTEGVMLPGSGPAASATIAGNLEFFVGLPQTAALAGDKLSIFAIVTKEFATDIVVSKEIAAKAKLTPDTPMDKKLDVLKGLRIASWTPGGSSDMLIRYIAAKKGWNADSDMTLMPIGPAPPMIAAVENNRADAYIISAPASIAARKAIGRRCKASPICASSAIRNGWRKIQKLQPPSIAASCAPLPISRSTPQKPRRSFASV